MTKLYGKTDGPVAPICQCADDPAWNIPAHSVPICDAPEYTKDGLCVNCDHGMGCHMAPIDYRELARELAEALDQAVTSMQDSGYSNQHVSVKAARAALAKFRDMEARSNG